MTEDQFNAIFDGLDLFDYQKDALRWRINAAAPSASIADTAGAKLTSEDVERQYQDGVHIGSGLPRATCPCGFCAKHRHGFNQGSEPKREMTANERWAHHPLIPLSAYSNAAPPAPSVADAAGASDSQLFQRLLHARSELGRTIADPMWAGHAEVPKDALKRWHSTIDTVIAKESGK